MTDILDNEKPWGMTAGELLAQPKPAKWDVATAKWRLEDHCRALVQEGQSREDTLQYLKEYNRAGAEDPGLLEKYLPELVQLYEAHFAKWDFERSIVERHMPPTEERVEENAFRYPVPAARQDQEGLFPLGEVSLLGGPSGAGKTTWFLPVLEDIRNGRSVLGRPSVVMDYRVVMHDRSLGAFLRTARRMNLDDEARERVYRLDRKEQKMAAPEFLTQYILRLLAAGEDVRIIFVEGLDMWAPGDIGKMADVQEFLDALGRVAERFGVSIVGSVGNPKAKRGEEYQLQRDKIFGSVAWGRKVETIVGVQYADKEDVESKIRVVTVLPRNGHNEIFYCDFKGGRMVEIEKPAHLQTEVKENPLTKKFNALAQIRELPNGTKLTRTMLGLSKDTYAEVIHAAIQQHIVRKDGNRNLYIVTGGRIPTNSVDIP